MTMHAFDIERELSVRVTRPDPDRLGGFYHSFVKRCLDIFLVIISLPAVILVILGMAMAVGLSGGNPFYSQLRVGRNGKSFRIWKIRTMVKDADAKLEAYLEQNLAARAEWDATQKLKNDPRITRVGRLLRKTSLDELPQLWNVLTGSMSLIGPRPMMVDQKEQYPGEAYYAMRPGITGFWQVSDRNECDFADRADFDDDYARQVSFGTDAKVLLKTVKVVMDATGH